MNPTGALEGLRVLDFSRVLAGPFCTMMLADLGADVIKVENPQGGDDTREWGPPWAGEGDDRQSAYFLSVNRNKRSVVLDLKTEAGRETARRLAARSDVLVENFKPGAMAKFGLSYERLKEDHPQLIYCSITGFGQEGPYRDRPGYDFVIQAMSGLMSITGPEEGPPFKVGVAVSDVTAGLFAASSILAALHYRRSTGLGQKIDVSLLNSQLAALVNVAANYLVSRRPPERHGNQHANIVPYQTFRAADGWFVLAVGNDAQFAKLCDLIDQSELAADDRFQTNPARVANRRRLEEILAPILERQTVEEWVRALLKSGIPAGPINDIPSILEDPHVAAQGLLRSVWLEGATAVELIGPPVHLSETPAVVTSPPPTLGQHTEEVLRQLEREEAAAGSRTNRG